MSDNCCKINNWVDLAPDIVRRRMILEGTLFHPFNPQDMLRYSKELSSVLDMTPVGEPQVGFAQGYGWCCYMCWKESGMHIYSWENRLPVFFSVDIYTCKNFEVEDVLDFSKVFFGSNLIKLTWKE